MKISVFFSDLDATPGKCFLKSYRNCQGIYPNVYFCSISSPGLFCVHKNQFKTCQSSFRVKDFILIKYCHLGYQKFSVNFDPLPTFDNVNITWLDLTLCHILQNKRSYCKQQNQAGLVLCPFDRKYHKDKYNF